jgi:hypothetical protein
VKGSRETGHGNGTVCSRAQGNSPPDFRRKLVEPPASYGPACMAPAESEASTVCRLPLNHCIRTDIDNPGVTQTSVTCRYCLRNHSPRGSCVEVAVDVLPMVTVPGFLYLRLLHR